MNFHPGLGFETYAAKVKLKRGETVHFMPGYGYYAAPAGVGRLGQRIPTFHGPAPAQMQGAPAPLPLGAVQGGLEPAPVAHPKVLDLLHDIVTNQLPAAPVHPLGPLPAHPFLGHNLFTA